MKMRAINRICVLTSGGDSPGMNAAIRAIVREGISRGLEVYGIQRGYQGLIENDIRKMTTRDVGGILHIGGTVLQTARSLEFKTESGMKKALKNLKQHKINGLVVIGGDGSLRGAMELNTRGINVVGIPSTIDNDIAYTQMAIGVDTCLNTVVESIDKIKDTASSHDRLFIIEVMGRNSGYIALHGGLAAGADIVLIPEKMVSFDSIIRLIKIRKSKGKTNTIIVNAEGAEKAGVIKQNLERKINYEIRVTVLGHVQRGGSPSAFDRILATRFGCVSVDGLLKGVTGVMTALNGSKYSFEPLDKVLSHQKKLDISLIRDIEILAL